jgi:hypothetical protein
MKNKIKVLIIGAAVILGIFSAKRVWAGKINPEDDLIFIHHSCGQNWLAGGLREALSDKPYIHKLNDIYYGTVVQPDAGRPASLGKIPGNKTNMNHWLFWFNDYFEHVKTYGAGSGQNQIIILKSCFTASNISSDGVEPGDPFSEAQTLADYKAVYRNQNGKGNYYTHNSYAYRALEDIFAANPDRLFIIITSPPRNYGPQDATNDKEARRARIFADWLKNEWLISYNAAHPGFHNVAVFDWLDLLAYPDNDAKYPDRLRLEYGGNSGNSHPNKAANQYSTGVFAVNAGNFLDQAVASFTSSSVSAVGN